MWRSKGEARDGAGSGLVSSREPRPAAVTQEGGMWPRLPADVIRTGWGTEEDILQRLWDFPCGNNPQLPRTLSCRPGRVLEEEQEETGGTPLQP